MRRDPRAQGADLIELSDTEQTSLAHHLEIAAKQYDRDAEVCDESDQERLAEQFKRQAQQARDMAEFFGG